MTRVVDVDGFSTDSLRLLLACQEYPEGTLALKIEAELTHRRERGEA
jgi:hypothetical protein